jgi:hypothetical protein
MVAASMNRAFIAPFARSLLSTFSELQHAADVLRRESDPVSREDLIRRDEGGNMDGAYRSIEARMPANARVFVLDMLESEYSDKIGCYYYLTYFFFPREVTISLDQPPAFKLNAVTGRKPASLDGLRQAGYDFAVQIKPRKVSTIALGSLHLQPPETRPKPIPGDDWFVALLLPLAVALTGSRLVRWLFRDLQNVLSTGERLASGLAVGAFFLTQMTLTLRLVGARLEQVIIAVLTVWAAGEGVLLGRRWCMLRLQLKVHYLWWLLLVPAALLLWCQFRLAGLLGLQEFDAVAIWAFKAKILHYYAGKEVWRWFRNPGLAYAHFADYPLLVPLLHALTYGALGHVNEFVTKFWNQWMLLLLAWAVLGAGRFPEKRPWLAGSVAVAIALLPMTRQYALMEGATVPMLFYTVLSSVQLAIGVVEQQAGRVRLGLLLLMAAAMVRSEGVLLLGLWVILIMLDRKSRVALWPLRRLGWAGWLGIAAWFPYVVFRLQGPVPHPASAWVSLLFTNTRAVVHILPMTWIGMLARRFLNNGFALWDSPDNEHAVWEGHWAGWQSLGEQSTQGMSWVCVLLVVGAWFRGGRLRWMVFCLFLVFMAFLTVVSFYWSTVESNPMDYTMALFGSGLLGGGRYLYPVLMAWFVAGVILLLRESPGKATDYNNMETYQAH